MGLYQGDKLLSSIGKSPAAYAKDAGYTGTDDNFYTALANMPDHLSNQENPHGTTASQVGADVAGAANEALNSAKAYTDQIVAGVIPGDGSKESPADSDSIFIYDNADSGKPKKTLISKVADLFKNTFYTKDESNTLLSNNDPRQWGIGSDSGTLITDGNDALLGGAYYWGASNTNLPFKWGSMRVDPRLTSSIGQSLMQTAYSEDFPGCAAQRQVIDGVFKPWEWENPPMLLGVEYRTTERYQGKPVYVKMIDFGAMPNATQKGVEHGISNMDAIVGNAILMTRDGLTSSAEYTYEDISHAWCDRTSFYMRTKADMTSFSATVTIKYTKTTD